MSPALLSFVSQRGLLLHGVLDMNRTLAVLLGVTEQGVIGKQIEGEVFLSRLNRSGPVLRSSYTMRTKCAISEAFVRYCVIA